MVEAITAKDWLQRLSPGSKVLLLNPYVQDVRYPWVRWNQPVDLLKLGRLLTSPDFGCEVELIDCMLPGDSGRVPDRYVDDLATGERFRTFGVLLDKAQRQLLTELSQSWAPDYVVISTLTSYWGPRVVAAIRATLKSTMPQVQVVLTGGFAKYERELASRTRVDTIITDDFPSSSQIPLWNLYQSKRTQPFHEGRRCRFAGLTFGQAATGGFVLDQVRRARESGINTFVFFVDDIFAKEGRLLNEALDSVGGEGRIDFHGLCGIDPTRAPVGMWEQMLKAGFRSVHLEYPRMGEELDLESYARAASVLGGKLTPGELSGFVDVGRPGDELATLIQNTLEILATVGSIIPKPFTPSPIDHEVLYREVVQRSAGRLDRLGPRAFPLNGLIPGLSKDDFEDFFGLTTELNKKYHGRPFDLFDPSAITQAFSSSLRKGVWKLVEY